jgi:hypothetical protein
VRDRQIGDAAEDFDQIVARVKLLNPISMWLKRKSCTRRTCLDNTARFAGDFLEHVSNDLLGLDD